MKKENLELSAETREAFLELTARRIYAIKHRTNFDSQIAKVVKQFLLEFANKTATATAGVFELKTLERFCGAAVTLVTSARRPYIKIAGDSNRYII